MPAKTANLVPGKFQGILELAGNFKEGDKRRKWEILSLGKLVHGKFQFLQVLHVVG